MSSMSESHWWYLFHKEVKSLDSTTWFRIWQFQTLASKAVSSNASPGWTVRFLGGNDRGFLKEGGKQDLPKNTNVASWLAKFFSVFTSIVYDVFEWRRLKSYWALKFWFFTIQALDCDEKASNSIFWNETTTFNNTLLLYSYIFASKQLRNTHYVARPINQIFLLFCRYLVWWPPTIISRRRGKSCNLL